MPNVHDLVTDTEESREALKQIKQESTVPTTISPFSPGESQIERGVRFTVDTLKETWKLKTICHSKNREEMYDLIERVDKFYETVESINDFEFKLHCIDDGRKVVISESSTVFSNNKGI